MVLTELQQILTKTARDFLQHRAPLEALTEHEVFPLQHDAALWKEIADLGWLGLAFPEAYGGQGFGFVDLTVILEEMGAALHIKIDGDFIMHLRMGPQTQAKMHDEIPVYFDVERCHLFDRQTEKVIL